MPRVPCCGAWLIEKLTRGSPAVSQTSRTVVLVPGASRSGAHKRWPLRHWLDLAAGMKDRCELRWSLGPDEAELRV